MTQSKLTCLLAFFKYWSEAFISEVEIPHKLYSHNVHNLFRIGTVTAIQSKGEKL